MHFFRYGSPSQPLRYIRYIIFRYISHLPWSSAMLLPEKPRSSQLYIPSLKGLWITIWLWDKTLRLDSCLMAVYSPKDGNDYGFWHIPIYCILMYFAYIIIIGVISPITIVYPSKPVFIDFISFNVPRTNKWFPWYSHDITHMLHVWNIYPHLPEQNTPVLQENVPYMEHMGYIIRCYIVVEIIFHDI